MVNLAKDNPHPIIIGGDFNLLRFPFEKSKGRFDNRWPLLFNAVIDRAGYYRRFIENFSKIAKPLTDLLKKDKKFVWSEKAEEAFQVLKTKLTTAPVLVLPNTSKDFVIFCDASLQGLGCVLMQDGHVVAYASRQLKIGRASCRERVSSPV